MHKNTPVIAEEGQFVLRDMQGENLMKSPMVDGPNSRTGFTPLVGSHPSLGHASSRASEPEEDLISVTTRTEDDPVREAFERALNDSSLLQFGPDDDEQDEIVYSPPRNVLTILDVEVLLKSRQKWFITSSRSHCLKPDYCATNHTAPFQTHWAKHIH